MLCVAECTTCFSFMTLLFRANASYFGRKLFKRLQLFKISSFILLPQKPNPLIPSRGLFYFLQLRMQSLSDLHAMMLPS